MPTERIIASIACLMALLLSGCGNKGAESKHTNRLANASSPYLREHADNPVDWYEWGDEALNKAKSEGKPLIISIGYASCHWCHVMERESFMDTAVARLMNERFVAIKVDREERPDIDQIYMNAAQLISGNGGWPLNAFALPDGKPFYAATYFPKEQWTNVLRQISKAYRENNQQITSQAESLTKGISSFEVITSPDNGRREFDKKFYDEIFGKWETSIDFHLGGLKGAPKFPIPSVWEFAFQNNYLTGNVNALNAAIAAIDKMAMGGIYDHLRGGFARYATDSLWNVPHFEKMLYDNGQLVSLYAHAYQVTGNSAYKKVIEETLDFVKTEMTSSEGGFYSSLNADSEGEEGKFYVWKKSEIENVVGKSAVLFNDYYSISESGNWENGKNILFTTVSDADFLKKHSLSSEEWQNIRDEGKKKLLARRNKRIRPSLDDKILTSWNALMLNGYVDAYFATGSSAYLETALSNAKFLEKNILSENGRLMRNYKDGTSSIDAFLDDYAFLSKAFLHLYEATLDIHWLEKARLITDYAIQHFLNKESGVFFYTSDQSPNVVARKMELADNVTPSSNSVIAEVAFRIGEYYDMDSYRAIARVLVNQVLTGKIDEGPYYANWASVMGLMSYGPFEVAVMGVNAIDINLQLHQRFLPTSIFMGGNAENLPLLESKLISNKTIIYVCRDRVCRLPVQEVDKAWQQLEVRR